jgi:hypothetical protein
VRWFFCLKVFERKITNSKVFIKDCYKFLLMVDSVDYLKAVTAGIVGFVFVSFSVQAFMVSQDLTQIVPTLETLFKSGSGGFLDGATVGTSIYNYFVFPVGFVLASQLGKFFRGKEVLDGFDVIAAGLLGVAWVQVSWVFAGSLSGGIDFVLGVFSLQQNSVVTTLSDDLLRLVVVPSVLAVADIEAVEKVLRSE